MIILIVYFITSNILWVKIGFVIGVVSLLSTRFTDIIVLIWSKIMKALGFVNSHILLSAIFFIILLPISLLYKIFNRDSLNMKSGKQTYFTDRNKKFTSTDLENPW